MLDLCGEKLKNVSKSLIKQLLKNRCEKRPKSGF